jgi:hypothetical protein
MIVINIEQEKIEWKPVQTKNGLKHYATLALDFLKEPDDRGQTHAVWNNQSAEARAEKAKKNYCGRGKQVSYNAPTGKKEFAVNQQESEDNLPF